MDRGALRRTNRKKDEEQQNGYFYIQSSMTLRLLALSWCCAALEVTMPGSTGWEKAMTAEVLAKAHPWGIVGFQGRYAGLDAAKVIMLDVAIGRKPSAVQKCLAVVFASPHINSRWWKHLTSKWSDSGLGLRTKLSKPTSLARFGAGCVSGSDIELSSFALG